MWPRCFKPGLGICKGNVNVRIAKDVDCPKPGSFPEQTQPLPVSSPRTAAFVRRDRQAEAGGGSAQDQEWDVCGECAHQVRAEAPPAPPALGAVCFGDPRVLLALGVSGAPKLQCWACRVLTAGSAPAMLSHHGPVLGWDTDSENSPAQLNGPSFALLRVRNHWALFLFLHKGLRTYFALKAGCSPKDFSPVECRGWAGTEGGIALELLQAKENEAPLSPMQWSSHTLSFKVSWDMGTSQPRAPGAEVSPLGYPELLQENEGGKGG